MSVVIFTVAELGVLSTMLGGLIRKRAHASTARPPAEVTTPS